MKHTLKKIGLSVLRFVPLVLCAIFMGIYLFSQEEITVESLLDFAPEKPLNAAVFLIALYAFKSLTVVFPIIILNVLGGFLFEPAHALIINSIGVIIELAIPYWIGKCSGAGFVNKLEEKHPKLTYIIGEESGNQFFLSFFLRALFCLPGDAISMYFGAVSMPFGKYLLGSFLGIMPGTIAFTLLGMSITDPTSPMFWVSIVLTIGVSLVSVLCFKFWKKRKL